MKPVLLFLAAVVAGVAVAATAQFTNTASRGSCPATRFHQNVTPTAQGTRFTFQSDSPLQRVDLHYGVNGAAKNSVNLQMRSIAPTQWELTDQSFIVSPNDSLQYWFTYGTGTVDCDTEVFTAGSGSGGSTQPLLQFQQFQTFQPQINTQSLMQQPQQFVTQPLSSGYGQNAQPLMQQQFIAPATSVGGICPAARFQQSATPSAQGTRFTFQSDSPLQRVDLHYGFNGAAKNSVNLQMRSASPTQWELTDQSLTLSPNDSLQYWFTYGTGTVDCDTELFTLGSSRPLQQPQAIRAPVVPQSERFIPQAIMAAPTASYGSAPQALSANANACPAIRFQQSAQPTGSGTRFTFQSADGTPLHRVDLHYGLNGAAKNSVNLRMRSVSPTLWEIIDQSLNLGNSDSLNYWFTYCTGPIDCDTEVFTLGSGQVQPQAVMQPQFQPLSSGYGQQAQPLTQQQFIAPAASAGNCPAIRFQQSATPSAGQGTRFTFQSDSPLQRVDLHYGLNGAAKNSVNLRMRSVSPTQWEMVDQSLNMGGSDALQYWFTYSTGTVNCDTEVFNSGTNQPQAIMTAPQSYNAAPAAAIQAIMAAPLPSYGSAPQALTASGGGQCPAVKFTHKVHQTQNGLRFKFQSMDGVPLNTVDLHFGINDQPKNAMNVKMRSSSPTLWHHSESVPLSGNDRLQYWFTYRAANTDCDTEVFTFGSNQPQAIMAAPQPYGAASTPAVQPILAAPPASYGPLTASGGGQCPSTQFNHREESIGSGAQFMFQSLGAAAAWVDVHYGVNGQPPTAMNTRMKSSDGKTWLHTDSNLPSLNGLRVYYSYSVNGVDCDTEIFGSAAPQAIMAAPTYAPAPALQPIMTAPVPAPSYGAPQPIRAAGQCPMIQFNHREEATASGAQFTFESLSDVAAWVDVHYGVNGQPPTAMNVRMKSIDSGKKWIHTDSNLKVLTGLRVYYSYSVNGVDCDTESFGRAAPAALSSYGSPQPIMTVPTYNAPAPQPITAAPLYGAPQPIRAPGGQCPVIKFNHREETTGSSAQFTFESLGDAAAWVDVHYGVNGQPPTAMNIRMKSIEGGKKWTHTDSNLLSLTSLRVYYSYSVNGVDCDTEIFGGAAPAALSSYGSPAPAPQPIMAAPSYAPAPQPIIAVPPAPSYGAPILGARAQCPIIQFNQNVGSGAGGMEFKFQSLGDSPAWVDAHWGMGGQVVTSMNVRMKPIEAGKTWIHSDSNLQSLAGGMRYYFTYSANGVECDTEIFRIGDPAPQPIMAAPSYAPTPQPLAAAPAYTAPAPAPAPQPILAAPSYTPAPQPLAAAPAYSAPAPAPQPIMAAPAPAPQPPAPVPQPIRSYAPAPQPIRVQPQSYATPQPVMAAPSYVPAPQPLAAAPSYSAPAPQPIMAAPSYAPAPQPLSAPPSYAPAPQPLAAAPAYNYAPPPTPAVAFAGVAHRCPITGMLLPFPSPLMHGAGFGGGFAGGFGAAPTVGAGFGGGAAGIPVVGAQISGGGAPPFAALGGGGEFAAGDNNFDGQFD